MFTTARRHGLPLPSPTAKNDRDRQKQALNNINQRDEQSHPHKGKDKPPALSAPPTPNNVQSHARAGCERPATATAAPASFSRATGRTLAHANSQHSRPLTASGSGSSTGIATHLPLSVPQSFPTPTSSPSLTPLLAQTQALRLAMPRPSASACATPSPLSSGLPSPTLPPLPSSHLAGNGSSQPQSAGAGLTQPLPHVRSPVINIGSGSPSFVSRHHARKLSVGKDDFDYRVVRPTHMRKFSTSSESESVTSPKSPTSMASPASRGSGSSMREDVLSPGDRVGEGLMLQSQVLRRVFSESDNVRSVNEEPAAELEVVRRLGAGSYAIVYLVREVLRNPPPGILDGLDNEKDHRQARNGDVIDELDLWEPTGLDLDSDPLELDGMRRQKENDESGCEKVYYGKEYAVKVLSKAGMDEEALEAQLVEANIHQSLPTHPNIVTLHRALETPSFLLLVLEFVPGEDLYYFLEQARDHYEPEPSSSGSASSESDGEGRRHKANLSVLSVNSVSSMNTTRTPPTPSLLSTLNEKQLLGRKRLRLIASMFAQMCEAVAVCHDVGVYHRDIKPENFIVTDGWEEGGERRRVVVKLTDFGLSTRDTASSDMDCGSAPYMSYECRNNCAPTYSPRAADVWSLGIVLINMLYHVNPWTDTTHGVCPSFSAFLASPEHFFMQRFAGMVPAVASFLCQRVFCILPSEDPSDNASRRVSAHEFGKWARDLPRLMATEEPVGIPLALTIAATDKAVVSSLTFPARSASPLPAKDEEKQKQQQQQAEKESEAEAGALSPTSPSSTLLAQSLAAVLAQQEAAAATGPSSPAWRYKRGLSNASLGYALSSVPQSRRPASRQQSFSAERAPHYGLPGVPSLGSAAGSRAVTPLLRGRALGSVGPKSRVPSMCETPAQMGTVAELPTVFDEGEGDLSSGSLGLELGNGHEADIHKDGEKESAEGRDILPESRPVEQERKQDQDQDQEHEQEQDGEDEDSLSRSTSIVRRRKRGARRGKGQIIQQQQLEIARLQQQQEQLARQVQIMQEQLEKQQQTQTQVKVLSSLDPILTRTTMAPKTLVQHHSQSQLRTPQSPTGSGDALDSLASASEALARELSRTRNVRRGAPSSTLNHTQSHSHLQSSSHSYSHHPLSQTNSSSSNVPSVTVSSAPSDSASSHMRAISSSSLGTMQSASAMQASPAAALALASAGGPTPGAMFPVSFASSGRSSSAKSGARRSQASSSSASAKTSLHDGNVPTSSSTTNAPTPTAAAPAIAKKTSKWKLSFGKGSSSVHSRTPLSQIQAEATVLEDNVVEAKKRDDKEEIEVVSRIEGDVAADAARQRSIEHDGSAQHGALFPSHAAASRTTSVLMSLDANTSSTGIGAGNVLSSPNASEPWSRGRRPGNNHPWNASTPSTDRWPNVERERNVSPNSTRTGRSGNLSALSSSASSVSQSSAASSNNNWRHSTLTTSSAASNWTRYSNASMRSVSTVATSVSGGSSGSWRNGGNTSNASLASADRKPGYHHGPPSIASRKSGKSGMSDVPPPNVKIMTGVPWALDELPRQLHPNPSGDIFGMPPAARKQRVRKPKDLPTINERPGQVHHNNNGQGGAPGPSSAFGQYSKPGKSPLSQRADAARSSTSLPRNSSEGATTTSPLDDRDGGAFGGDVVGSEERERMDGAPRKVQKGQINALAKMLSALRR